MNVTFRSIQKEDAPRLVQYANNRNVWLNLRDYFPNPYKLDDANWFIDMCKNHPLNKIFAISLEEGFIGVVGIHPLTDVYSFTGELGYWIGEEHWGNGYTSTAVNWITQYAWQNTELQRIEAGVFSYNLASMRILEKCGYQKECIKRRRIKKDGAFHDEHLYSILRAI